MRIVWIVAAGVIVAGAIVAMLATREQPQLNSSAQPPRKSVSSSDNSTKLATRNAARAVGDEPVLGNVAAERDFEKELQDTQDRLEFVEKVLDEAKRGNGAAQYHLSLALSDCKAYDNIYFRDGDRRRTYDEVMQVAVKRGGFTWEYLADKFRRCKRLLEIKGSPFGTAEDWMTAATENGYPRAQAQTAWGLALRSRNELEPDKSENEREQARGLALSALRSKDPGAIFMVGNLAMFLDKRDGAENPYDWVWELAACERGYDCSRQSMWYQFRCGGFDPMCQPDENGVVDVVRRITGERFPELQRRATEINEKLDQDRFDELGF